MSRAKITTTSATLTVSENADATTIGLVAPVDTRYSASQLTIKVTGLPTDGTVLLADGVTKVYVGESLTVAQLTGLKFRAIPGVFGQSSKFSYTVTDPSGCRGSGSATLAIGPDTTPPVTTAASLTVAENAAATAIGIIAPSDINYAASALTITVTGLPSDGTVYLADGVTAVTSGATLTVAQLTGLTFKPNSGLFSQTASFSYTVKDPAGLSTPGSATLMIGPDTSPPVTTDPTLTVAGNSGPTAMGIAAPTDINYSATQLTVTVTGLPSDGTVLLADGVTAVTNGETLTVAQLTGLTFKPTPGLFSQSSTFSYTVTNPAGLSASDSVTLEIAAASGGPQATAASLTVAENAAATAIGIVAPSDINYAASALTITVSGLPTDGTVLLADKMTAVTSGETLTVAQLTGLTFKATSGLFSQSSTFSYTVKDPAGLSTSGSATLAIGPDTTPPVTTSASLTVSENAAATAIGIAAPTDINYTASQLSVTVTGALPTDGTVYLADGVTAVTSGEILTVAQLTGLKFAPTSGVFSKSSTFNYSVSDPSGLSASGSATLAIGPDTTPPVTTAASLTVAQNAAATAIGIASPTDANYSASQLTVTVTALPSDGTVLLADKATAVTSGETLTVAQLTGLTFKPTSNVYSQSSQFTYSVTDPSNLSTSGTATLAIAGASGSGPVTTAASLTVAANAATTTIGIAAPTDPNYSASQLTVTLTGTLPTDGTVYLADGVTAVTSGEILTVAQLTGLKFTPTPGAAALSEELTYSVADPAGKSATGSATVAIAPPSGSTILTVGPGKQYATIKAAIAASHNGDTIQVQAGTYTNDFASINTDITLEGVGGMVNMVSTVQIPNGKAILITDGNDTINNFSFSGAYVAPVDANGAGIRYQGGNLVLNDDYFFNNQEGLLGAANATGTITINYCEFANNGVSDPKSAGYGYTHNIYVNDIAQLTINNSYFHNANEGHEIKSRAANTTIQNSRIDDGPTGTASVSIDLPNGGNARIKNNVIEQGPLSDNPGIIDFGEEGSVYSSSSLQISGNQILNDMSSSSALAVWNAAVTTTAQITSNQFYGLSSSQIASGSATQSNNLFLTTEPALITTHPWSY